MTRVRETRDVHPTRFSGTSVITLHREKTLICSVIYSFIREIDQMCVKSFVKICTISLAVAEQRKHVKTYFYSLRIIRQEYK